MNTPSFSTFTEGQRSGIRIGGWEVSAVQGTHIANETVRDELERQLALPELPEMLHDRHEVILTHGDKFSATLNTLHCLQSLPKEAGVQVAAAREWQEANSGYEQARQFDWTYSTHSHGDVRGTPCDQEGSIDTQLLMRRDPILWSTDVILFEDELHDCGVSQVRVRARVMPTCFLVLMRSFVRADNVVVRLRDTRFFHVFGSDTVVQDMQYRECKWERLPPYMRGIVIADTEQAAQTVFSQLPVTTHTVRVFSLV
ncbi:MAG: hypothetical protein MHM6MM_002596 [Cercozoa sp. M6MM]